MTNVQVNGVEERSKTDDALTARAALEAEAKAKATAAATVAWESECWRVETLRLKYAPDAPVWRPARPHEPPVSRPSWLTAALAAEAKVRDRELAAAEAEQIRRSKCDVTRGEFESLLMLLGISSSSAGAHRRQRDAMGHYDAIEASARQHEAAEQRAEPERLKLLDAEKEKARKRWAEQDERARVEGEKADKARRGPPASMGGGEGFEIKRTW
jgi:hypothetical protein